MYHTDQKYIDALLNNDEAMLREIYSRFGRKIQTMVVQLGGTETDAADVIQDALLSILNRAKKSSFTLTCPFEGFFYLVCKRKWMKESARRNKRQVTIHGNETSAVSDDFELAQECILYEHRKSLIVEVMKMMGEKCRELLYLSWEIRSMEEVAAALNISYGYARKKKTECMTRLINLIHQSPQYQSLKE